jgi:putative ABC transport system ATP-binding protein
LPILQITALVKSYFKGDIAINAVDSISFTVNKGEIVSIVGRSGSGKSTLLNLIGGLDTASAGQIIYDGKKISDWSRNELATHRRFHVGMIFQSFNMIFTRNALDNVALALIFGACPKNQRKARAKELLKSVGLSDRIYHKPDELSGGETQRVAIARALANEPEIILADEPTGNLDSVTANEIIDLLVKLNKEQGKTILLVTHDQDTAEKISDRMIYLLDGKIVKDKKIRRKNEDR